MGFSKVKNNKVVLFTQMKNNKLVLFSLHRTLKTPGADPGFLDRGFKFIKGV